MKANTSKTIDNICIAARDEFARNGFSDARLENVAKAAGVSKQLVYHYFKSKDELYGIVLEDVARNTLSYLDDEAYDVLTPVETVELFIRRTVEAFAREPFIATMTLDEGLHNGAHISRRNNYIPLLKGFIERRIAPALIRGAEMGVFRANVDPELFYWAVFSISTAPFLNTRVMSQTSGQIFASDSGTGIWLRSTTEFVLLSLRP